MLLKSHQCIIILSAVVHTNKQHLSMDISHHMYALAAYKVSVLLIHTDHVLSETHQVKDT